MFDFIPVQYYSAVYYNILLAVVFVVFVHSYFTSIQDEENFRSRNWFSIGFLGFIIIFMGLRPISGRYFSDMGTYAHVFEAYAAGQNLQVDKDLVFEYFILLSSYVMTVEMFFLLCAILYVWPLYVVSKKFFNNYWFYGFLMLVVSMSFWGYGTNGIRNGIATSLFLYGFTIKNKYKALAIFILTVLIHKSLVLPTLAYVITMFYKETRTYLKFWLLTIPLSLALGGFWESFFLGLGFGEEDRLKGYLTQGDELLDVAVQTGFRWDFLLYSATGVFAGWYFVIRKKFDDPVYARLFNMYLITNGFWVLVIRANFSNRFAYLSWFMLGVIIIYPLLKMEFVKKQHQFMGLLMFAYFIFTYMLNFILTKE